MACLPTISIKHRRPLEEGVRAAVKEAQERLKELGFYEGQIDGDFGPLTEEAVKAFQRRRGLAVDGIIGPNAWGALYDESPQPAPGEAITAAELAEVAQRPVSAVARFVQPLASTFEQYEINTYLRRSHFLAQILHESMRLRYTSEIWGPTAAQRRYEGRADLGNRQPGDGYRYRGRGLIQLTGRTNYTQYNEAVEPDVVKNPDLVAEMPLAVDVAGWFWKRGTRQNLNEVADADDVRRVTRLINGGYNGLEDRKNLLERAKNVLRQQTPA